jgi:hypothetical protein
MVGQVRRLTVVVVLAAVSAVAGCVAVPQQQPGPGASPGPRPPVPSRQVPVVRPPRNGVQPSQNEVLATVPAEPERADGLPEPVTTTLRGRPFPAPPRPVPRGAAPVQPRPAPRAPVARRPHRTPAPRATDLCALGRTYGGWPAGSDAARICEGVYGG